MRGSVLAGLLIAFPIGGPAWATQLLSLQDFTLAPNQYVSGFTIQTFDIHVRAVCHMLPGWIITAGYYGSPVGQLSGYAGVGLAYLSASGLDGLKALFLIDDPTEILDAPRGSQPQTFNGRLNIGTYGLDEDDVWLRLKPSNYVLTPASRCPDPT